MILRCGRCWTTSMNGSPRIRGLQNQGDPLFFDEPLGRGRGERLRGIRSVQDVSPGGVRPVGALLTRRRIQHSPNRRAAILPGMRVLPCHRFWLRDRLPD